VRVKRPSNEGAKSALLFCYSPDRKGERPLAHLRSFSGVLHADGYTGFEPLYRPGKVSAAACWTYVRRKFIGIHAANASPVAPEATEHLSDVITICARPSYILCVSTKHAAPFPQISVLRHADAANALARNRNSASMYSGIRRCTRSSSIPFSTARAVLRFD
jgi:hypothetical protein